MSVGLSDDSRAAFWDDSMAAVWVGKKDDLWANLKAEKRVVAMAAQSDAQMAETMTAMMAPLLADSSAETRVEGKEIATALLMDDKSVGGSVGEMAAVRAVKLVDHWDVTSDES